MAQSLAAVGMRTTAGSLRTARLGPTTTLLNSCTVLIAGGTAAAFQPLPDCTSPRIAQFLLQFDSTVYEHFVVGAHIQTENRTQDSRFVLLDWERGALEFRMNAIRKFAAPALVGQREYDGNRA
jgi:hypothetical protein